MSLLNLKRIAKYRVRRSSADGEEMVDYIKQWWSQKYNRPDNDPLLLDKRLEELIVEYYEDFFKTNPDKLNEFETSIQEIPMDSDEAWFQKAMGDNYTPANAFSTEFKKDDKPVDEFNDVYPGS